ncbi:unnamed protein product [Calicophoron daubneyi]|uniref:G-protein coupled receptors family 1 profile domain-containing protein n=1 Tax=Calicophoron daubneyi TaxID=300641 RepID=A0AAV2TTC8_CALDB
MINETAYTLSQTTRDILFSYSLVIIIVGTIGNVLLLGTLIYKHVKQSQTSVTETNITTPDLCLQPHPTVKHKPPKKGWSLADELLLLLTVSDILCLWVLAVRYSILLSTCYDIRVYNTAVCKIHMYLSMVCTNLANAFLCIFSVQRAICIRWPLANYTWLSRKRLNMCVGVSLVFILLKHVAVFYFFEVLEDEDGLQCESTLLESAVFRAYYNFEFATHVVIGYSILIVANICLCIALHQRGSLQAHSGNELNTLSGERLKTQISDSATGGRNTARIILLFSIFQLITSVPFFVLLELSQLFELDIIPHEYRALTYYICTLAMFTNNAVNFFLLSSISERFRSDTKDFLRYLKTKCVQIM